MPNKVFGSTVETLGPSCSWVGDYSTFALPVRTPHSALRTPNIRVAHADDIALVVELASRVCSPVYVQAEGLDQEGLALDALNALYQKVGLSRYRRVFIAQSPDWDTLAGMALVYRGPLGFNFSFLENRCALILEPVLPQAQRATVIAALLSAAAETYAGFPPGFIPIVIDKAYAPEAHAVGAEYIRDYAQICRSD